MNLTKLSSHCYPRRNKSCRRLITCRYLFGGNHKIRQQYTKTSLPLLSLGRNLPLSGDWDDFSKRDALFQERGRTPCTTIHGTLLLRGRRTDPLQETVHMKDMTTFTPYCAAVSDGYNAWVYSVLTERTIIAWYLTCGAAAFVWYATYATNITFAISLIMIRVSGIPLPLSNSVPCLDLDLHQLLN